MSSLMVVVKKYSNRRLYDTAESRYITLDELAEKIRDGTEVRVVDAKSGEDLTAPVLTQIIIDGRGAGKLLPVSLLAQLIRLQDDVLADFLGKYLSTALQMYLAAKQGAQSVAPYLPFATWPFSASDALARLFAGQVPWAQAAATAPPAAPPAAPPPRAEADRDELASLRRELDEIKQALGKGRR